MSKSTILLSLTATLFLTPFASAADEPTLDQRLEKLAGTLERARKSGHIPGMSIAIVKDDEIIWARGFGLADIAGERAADENTIYAIGSTTKAFTATLTGMLVDEGKLTWDDPVTELLPYFDLQVRSEDENAACTLRDLLCHRHGFARMSLLWMNGEVGRKEVLMTGSGAEPWDDFRKGFHYCNVTYMAAGQAAGIAAETTWDDMMVDRIFSPLGMTSSTVTAAKALEDPRLAVGYRWKEDQETTEVFKMVTLNNIGPAGSVNSNVLDMAQWLRLQLGRGEVDGNRLISSDRLLETWEPQIEIGSGVSYGLGWMLHEIDGRDVVEHGGNIGGFSAQVGMMPEENLGYVLLTNLSVAPLQQSSLPMVFGALLEEWPDATDGSSADAKELELEQYAGTYIANFADFTDAEFKVLVLEDKLAVDIPGQQVFELKQPDAEGKWYFALTNQIAVSFQRNGRDAVVGLSVHQAGFQFEVPREGVAVEVVEAPPEFKKYVGTFVRAIGGKHIKILIQGGRLAMEDKGKVLEFNTPDADGHASLRARADFGATFKTDSDGKVVSLVFHGSSGDRLFTRLEEAPDPDLPTLEQIHALRKTEERVAAIQASGGSKVTGDIWVAQAGLRGELTVYTRGTDCFANHMDFGKFGRVDTVLRRDRAWSYNAMSGLDELSGTKLTQAILDHPSAVDGNWSDYFDSVEVLRSDTLDERAVYVVGLNKGDLPRRSYWIDAETGDVLKVEFITIEGPVRIPITMTYSGFELVNGIRSARQIEIENPASGRIVMTLKDRASGLELGDEVFSPPNSDDED